MKKMLVKKLLLVTPEPLVKKASSKPAKKTGLSKTDPDYFRKIGQISAKKRKMTSEQFSQMAKASHPRVQYRGGRKPKAAADEQ